MDISIITDTYQPSIDGNGNYIDKIPIIDSKGILCSCASRKDKIYNSVNKFSQHIKCKKHKEWLDALNKNKANHYIELEKCKEIVKSQQQILTQYEIKMQQKDLTIQYLTNQLTKHEKNNIIDTDVDLLDLNSILD